MEVKEMFDEKLSRRGLLKGAAGAAGIAALASGGLSLFSKAEAKGGPTEKWLWPKKSPLDEQVLVARPTVPLGGVDIGYLPGDIKEKLHPWMQPIFDNLEFIVNTPRDVVKDHTAVNQYKSYQYLIDTDTIHIEPLTYIRGRSLPKRYFIVDEAQQLRPIDIKTIVTRCGEGTKIVFTGDLEQVDHPFLDSHSNGLAYLISRFINEATFCYLNLTKTARSSLAERAAKLL